MKRLPVIIFFILSYIINYAQVMPADGSRLNYRLIGFKLPSTLNAADCKIEIASGNFISEDSFIKHVIKAIPVNKNKVIGEVPFFGAQYTWRYSYSLPEGSVQSHLLHFSTTSVPEVDTTITRFRIMQTALKYKDCYVFLDGNRTLYDMSGRPVWYLTNTIWAKNEKFLLSDLKLSPYNTITFLKGAAYEIDYDGNILWKGPNNGKVSGDTTEHYHHEFTRLHNGHYLVLGSEFTWKFPSSNDSLFTNANISNKTFNNVEFGTLIEYDQKGNIIWSWKSSKYFLKEDPDFKKPFKRYFSEPDYNFIHPSVEKLQEDVHENGFYFDEKNNVIYLSFKNISKVLKLKYPEGIVLNSYGANLNAHPGIPNTESDLFCHQHSCRISQDGYLYLFNNNLCDTSPAKVIIMREPADKNNELKKVWEYQCTVEGNNVRRFFSGGNVLEMSDGSIFISMGSDYSKVLIVNRNKKVLWSAIPEKWDSSKRKWEIIHQSRASIISREQFEDLIWNSK